MIKRPILSYYFHSVAIRWLIKETQRSVCRIYTHEAFEVSNVALSSMQRRCDHFLRDAYKNSLTNEAKWDVINICSNPLWIYRFIYKNMFAALLIAPFWLPYNLARPSEAVFGCVCEKLIEAGELLAEEKQKADDQIAEVNKLSSELICTKRLVQW